MATVATFMSARGTRADHGPVTMHLSSHLYISSEVIRRGAMYADSAESYFDAAARLISLADRMPGVIRDTLTFVDRLDRAATHLEGHTCTGTPYWRDKDKPHKQPKLYVIHPTGVFCPLHGMPQPEKRIRTYIGVDAYKQAGALAAIADEERRSRLVTRRDDLSRKLAEAEAALLHLLSELGYDPETGKPKSRERSFTVEELLNL